MGPAALASSHMNYSASLIGLICQLLWRRRRQGKEEKKEEEKDEKKEVSSFLLAGGVQPSGRHSNANAKHYWATSCLQGWRGRGSGGVKDEPQKLICGSK